MARNEEKGLTLFSKWTNFKKDSHASSSQRRPLLSSDCSSLPDAEKHRREIVSNVTKKISAIQNASLGEHRIRELNDEINGLMKKKHYWELRIRELGGSDFKARGRQILDIEGREVPGVPGYRYYGAAKDLPGVRELLAEKPAETLLRKRNRVDLYKHITPDYYGFRDDDDGVLAAKEAARETELIAQAEAEFATKVSRLREESQRSGGVYGQAELDALLRAQEEEDDEVVPTVQPGAETMQSSEVAISELIVDQKKQNLLEAYLS